MTFTSFFLKTKHLLQIILTYLSFESIKFQVLPLLNVVSVVSLVLGLSLFI